MDNVAYSTPIFITDVDQLKNNLEILKKLREDTGAHILLAQKAFSQYSLYPLMSEYLSGATASGIYEAKLCNEYFKGENHVFSPAFTVEEMQEIVLMCDHITFNSISQLETHKETFLPYVRDGRLKVGLRVNPEFSTQEGHAIYDPCSQGSRLGIRRSCMPKILPEYVSGLHFHTLCEQDSEPLERTFHHFENSFAEYLDQISWINLGGGHHITRPGYDIERLKKLILYIRNKYNLEVYLEPGEAVALNAGTLETRVLDIVEASDMKVLILDTSAACHMPDVLEMPYRPPLKDGGERFEKKFTYRLAGRTCLASDVIGEYSFDREIKIGDKLVFEDMAIYSMVKTNTFNGMPLPSIAYREHGIVNVTNTFDYSDFKERL